VKSPLHSQDYKNSWYYGFMRLLTMGVDARSPQKLCNNASFIIFNYDRCLEIILSHSISNYFGIGINDAIEMVNCFDIIHPYGSLGSLSASREDYLQFGAENFELDKISNRIQTFTESVNSDIVSSVKDILSRSDQIIFLGFGFLPQNMHLLMPDQKSSATRIHATTCGISKSDKIVVQENLARFLRPMIEMELGEMMHVRSDSGRLGFIDVDNDRCIDLISNHRYRLAAG